MSRSPSYITTENQQYSTLEASTWTLGYFQHLAKGQFCHIGSSYRKTGDGEKISFNILTLYPPPSQKKKIRDFLHWKTYTTGHWKWQLFRQPACSCLILSHPKQAHSHGSRHIIQGWSDAQHFLVLRTTSEPEINVQRLLSPNRKFISNCETLSVLTNALRRMEWYTYRLIIMASKTAK